MSLTPAKVAEFETRTIGAEGKPGTLILGPKHLLPFPHQFIRYQNKVSPMRRSAASLDAGQRIWLCYHLHCMQFISPGCMYCDVHKKLCKKCGVAPRASRNGQYCHACMGKPEPTGPTEPVWQKKGKQLIHPTRYKKGRCETCGPRVTFENYRDPGGDVWVTRDKECWECYKQKHGDDEMKWDGIADDAQFESKPLLVNETNTYSAIHCLGTFGLITTGAIVTENSDDQDTSDSKKPA